MGDRRIDRAAWATVIADLIASETRGKKAAFARIIGVSTRTVDRWLAAEVDVSEQSVRALARTLSRPPLELLVQVGYYSAAEVGQPEPPDAGEDAEMQLILDADISDRKKKVMIDRLLELREQDKRRRVEDIQWWINQARGA